ncbi:hypothetical protein [Caballeronia glebae]|uniref:hypothetical protein n=1 Tax=Caballeronia glebae TaxID=1777143 RepID=UPI000AF76238|nr:hypothetical protein [Caballeronia glebae]
MRASFAMRTNARVRHPPTSGMGTCALSDSACRVHRAKRFGMAIVALRPAHALEGVASVAKKTLV